jgi:hypothetical protein
MKSSKLLLAGLICLAAADLANAGTIRICGSTAFRKATYKAITNLFDRTVSYSEVTFPSGNGATNAVFTGSIPGIAGTTIIKTSYAGSTGGISNLVRHALVSTFLKDSPANALDFEAPVQSNFTMADSQQASTLFSRASDEVLGFDPAGIITFAWVKNSNAPPTLVNITAGQARSLLSFNLPLSILTGVNSDSGTNVYGIGRDEESGTRTITFAESGFGTTTTPQQWFINSLTAALTSAGASGYSSGGEVAGALKVVGTIGANDPNNPGHGYYAIGYAGSSDANSVNGGANILTYNGFALTDNNVIEGSYSFWSYENIMYHTPLSGDLLTFRNLLLPRFNLPLGAANAAGLRNDQMNVGRNADGGDIFHN